MRDDSANHHGWLVLAIASFGLATVLTQAIAIALVAVGAASLAVSIFKESNSPGVEGTDRWVLGVVILFAILTMTASTRDVIGSPPDWVFVAAGVIWIALVLVWKIGGSRERVRQGIFAVALVATALFGAVHVVSAEGVGFDVLLLHTGAADAIADGVSPYSDAVKVPNGAPVGEEFIEGYPYPPLTAAAFAASDWVAGDPRWTSLVSWLVLLAVLGSSSLGTGSGTLSLGAMLMAGAIPSWPLVLTAGWTEPLSLALLAISAAVWSRAKVSGALSGLLIGSKQYLLAATPVYAINRLEQKWSRVSWASIAFLVTLLPVLFWGFQDFVDAAVRFHLETPARPDGTSVVGLLDLLGITWEPPIWLMIALVALVTLGVARRVTNPTTWLSAVGLVLTIALFMSSQAFTNYWYLMAGISALALAVSNTGSRTGRHAGE